MFQRLTAWFRNFARARALSRLLSHAAEHGHAAIVLVDATGHIVWLNRSAAKLAAKTDPSLTLRSMLGAGMRTLFATVPEAASMGFAARYAALRTRIAAGERIASDDVDDRFVSTDRGIDRSFHIRITATKDGTAFWIRDTTSRLALARTAAEREGAFQAMFKTAPEPMVTVDADCRIIAANDALAETFGYAQDELVGEPLTVLIPERFRERHLAGFRRFVETRERMLPSGPVQLPGLRRDGTEIPLEIFFGASTSGGRLMVTGFMRDLRARVAAEKARARIEEDLTFVNEAIYQIISSPDYQPRLQSLVTLPVPGRADWCAVHMRDEHGVIRLMAVHHADPAKVSLAWELERLFPTDESGEVAHVLRTGEPTLHPVIAGADIDAAVADPRRRELLHALGLRASMCVPISVDGEVIGALTLVMAESGRSFDERDLASMQQFSRVAALALHNARIYTALVEASTAKDAFSATLSHEVRTPLAAVKGFAEFALLDLVARLESLDPTDPATAVERAQLESAIDSIRRVVSSSKHLSTLIDQMLEMSRITAGKVVLDARVMDLGPLLDENIAVCKVSADARHLRVIVTKESAPIFVLADSVKLSQVFVNVISNAVKFTPDGGVIRISLERVGGVARVRVQDSGIGMPPEFLRHAFELYRQLNDTNSRPYGGLGIGLAIARKFTELHGGTISAASEGIGMGSAFTIDLPISSTAARPELDDSSSVRMRKPLPDLRGCCILVVDDAEATRAMLTETLRRCGASVDEAEHAARALELWNDGRYDGIAADITMPGMGGDELVRLLRSRGVTVPIVAYTASTSPTADELAGMGFDEVVLKSEHASKVAGAFARRLKK